MSTAADPSGVANPHRHRHRKPRRSADGDDGRRKRDKDKKKGKRSKAKATRDGEYFEDGDRHDENDAPGRSRRNDRGYDVDGKAVAAKRKAKAPRMDVDLAEGGGNSGEPFSTEDEGTGDGAMDDDNDDDPFFEDINKTMRDPNSEIDYVSLSLRTIREAVAAKMEAMEAEIVDLERENGELDIELRAAFLEEGLMLQSHNMDSAEDRAAVLPLIDSLRMTSRVRRGAESDIETLRADRLKVEDVVETLNEKLLRVMSESVHVSDQLDHTAARVEHLRAQVVAREDELIRRHPIYGRYYKELRREENNVKKLRLATREVEDLSARHASTMATVRERLEAVGVVSGGDSIGALRGATRAAQAVIESVEQMVADALGHHTPALLATASAPAISLSDSIEVVTAETATVQARHRHHRSLQQAAPATATVTAIGAGARSPGRTAVAVRTNPVAMRTTMGGSQYRVSGSPVVVRGGPMAGMRQTTPAMMASGGVGFGSPAVTMRSTAVAGPLMRTSPTVPVYSPHRRR